MSELKIESIPFKSSYEQQPVAGYLFYDSEVRPRAILQIAHGMAEYVMRYRDFAEYMTKHGFVVVGNDHLGHGQTSGTQYPDGYFGPSDGCKHVLMDLHTMNTLAHERYPGLPLVLFGHSMGSFFARWFVQTWPDAVTAAVYCGTAGANPAAPLALYLTELIATLWGPMHRSKLCYKLAFGKYNERFPDATSSNAWLSAEPENVAKYDADPKCGFMFTVTAFQEMLRVMTYVNRKEWFETVSKKIPVLITAGMEDPVGNYGAGPQEVADRLQAVGVRNVTVKLYDGMRHEILNETDRKQVYTDVLMWCRAAIRSAN